jgi:nucleoside-diphosphate-sugar epimerase
MPKAEIKILVTGACGQIGSELTLKLRERHGNENVIASDIVSPLPALQLSGPFVRLDVTQRESVDAIVVEHGINTVYHLVAILSAVGEERPHLAWDVNMTGLYNVLEVCRQRNVRRIFCPSSIAAFGPETPRNETPQETVMRPRTIYGITKLAGELLCNYYVQRFGVDVRGVRYPGVISSETLPGGGTTDYAVAIFYAAVEHKCYTCFVRKDTVLPMIYMPDCIRAAVTLMEADFQSLRYHADFNIAGLSFAAEELATEIKKHIPEFVCEYKPDFRQEIADSWPRTIDDSAARRDWGWRPHYDLAAMTAEMLEKLRQRHAEGRLYA